MYILPYTVLHSLSCLPKVHFTVDLSLHTFHHETPLVIEDFFTQVLAFPFHPFLCCLFPQCLIAHLYMPCVWIVWKKHRCIVAEIFFEQNILLPVRAQFNQVHVIATGFVVHTCSRLTHNFVWES